MCETEKVINIITVGDQKCFKSVFVNLFDYHTRLKTLKWPIQYERCRAKAIRRMQMNGEWVDNEAVREEHQMVCINYELEGFNTRYNVMDYSLRSFVAPDKIFQHCTGPQDTLNVLIVSVDCKKKPPDFVPRRFKEYEGVMERVLPYNSLVIFIRGHRNEEKQRAFFKSVLGFPNQEDNHFVFTDLSFKDVKMDAEETFNRNRIEFNRLIEYLDRVRPLSLESVKAKVELDVKTPAIIKNTIFVLKRYGPPVFLGFMAGAVSLLLVCAYRKYFSSQVLKLMRSCYHVIPTKQKNFTYNYF